MSTFCGGNNSVQAFTSQELLDKFPGGVLQSIHSMPQLNNDGLADESWVQETIKKLENVNILPKPTDPKKTTSTPFNAPETKDPLATYVLSDRTFQDKIKQEYCFYESRYFSALDNFLQSIADASLKGNPQNVNNKLDVLKKLNAQLILLTQVVNGISKYRYTENVRFQKDINSINDSLRQRQGRLQEQRNIYNKETAKADLYKQMVKYTVEKNNANQNLLTLYGVLNVVAIGIIVYLARK
jgi:hypothetical protein